MRVCPARPRRSLFLPLSILSLSHGLSLSLTASHNNIEDTRRRREVLVGVRWKERADLSQTASRLTNNLSLSFSLSLSVYFKAAEAFLWVGLAGEQGAPTTAALAVERKKLEGICRESTGRPCAPLSLSLPSARLRLRLRLRLRPAAAATAAEAAATAAEAATASATPTAAAAAAEAAATAAEAAAAAIAAEKTQSLEAVERKKLERICGESTGRPCAPSHPLLGGAGKCAPPASQPARNARSACCSSTARCSSRLMRRRRKRRRRSTRSSWTTRRRSRRRWPRLFCCSKCGGFFPFAELGGSRGPRGL